MSGQFKLSHLLGVASAYLWMVKAMTLVDIEDKGEKHVCNSVPVLAPVLLWSLVMATKVSAIFG